MANKPIIEIDVRAEAFEKFYALFEKYTEQLEEQPEAWKALNDAIDRTGGKMKASVGATAKSLGASADSSGDITRSLKDATAATRQLAVETKKSDALMLKFSKSSYEVANGIFEASTSVSGLKKVLDSLGLPGKIAALATAMAGAAGDAALQSARSVSSNAQAARGANLPYGAFKNAIAQMSPFIGDYGSVLQNVAAAQADPASLGKLAMFGVTPDMSPNQAALAINRRMISTFKATHNSRMPQIQMGMSVTGESLNDVIGLSNTPKKVLEDAMAAASNNVLAANQNVSDGTISSDQKLVASWAASMNAASAKFAEALAPLNPVVDDFGKSVANFADATNRLVQSLVGPGGTPQTGTGMSPILRNLYDPYHNPGNMMSNHKLISYPSERAGYAALRSLLVRKYNGMSLDKLVATYEGGTDPNDTGAGNPDHNNIKAYIANLKKWTGFNDTSSLNLTDPLTVAALIGAIVRKESGHKVSQSTIDGYLGIPAPAAPSARQMDMHFKRLMHQGNLQKVSLQISNSTSARVAVLANAATV